MAKTDTETLRIPDVEATIQNGDKVDLAEKYKSGILVLFSYPKANTGGCTRQTSGFAKLYPEFQSLGATVYGISADSLKSQTTFKNKTNADFDLISDPKYEILGPLHAKKQPRGVIRSHWVFLNGEATLEEHQVKPDASPEAALQEVRRIAETKDTKKKPAAKNTKPAAKTKPAKPAAKPAKPAAKESKADAKETAEEAKAAAEEAKAAAKKTKTDVKEKAADIKAKAKDAQAQVKASKRASTEEEPPKKRATRSTRTPFTK